MREVVRGTISAEELEAYSNAEIMLLDGADNGTGSQVTITGDMEWMITYSSSGFTDQGWSFASPGGWGNGYGGVTYGEMYQDGTLYNFLDKYGFYMLTNGLGAQNYVMAGCASLN